MGAASADSLLRVRAHTMQPGEHFYVLSADDPHQCTSYCTIFIGVYATGGTPGQLYTLQVATADALKILSDGKVQPGTVGVAAYSYYQMPVMEVRPRPRRARWSLIRRRAACRLRTSPSWSSPARARWTSTPRECPTRHPPAPSAPARSASHSAHAASMACPPCSTTAPPACSPTSTTRLALRCAASTTLHAGADVARNHSRISCTSSARCSTLCTWASTATAAPPRRHSIASTPSSRAATVRTRTGARASQRLTRSALLPCAAGPYMNPPIDFASISVSNPAPGQVVVSFQQAQRGLTGLTYQLLFAEKTPDTGGRLRPAPSAAGPLSPLRSHVHALRPRPAERAAVGALDRC
jgi:hypothetical protein